MALCLSSQCKATSGQIAKMRAGLRSCSKSNLHGLWGWQETHITHETRWGAAASQEKPLIYSINQRLLLRSNKCEWSVWIPDYGNTPKRTFPFLFSFYSRLNLTVTVSATIKHTHSKNGTSKGRERFAVNWIRDWILKVIDAEMSKRAHRRTPE